jgi:hypothetical protein
VGVEFSEDFSDGYRFLISATFLVYREPICGVYRFPGCQREYLGFHGHRIGTTFLSIGSPWSQFEERAYSRGITGNDVVKLIVVLY